jgi:hypothetical protein
MTALLAVASCVSDRVPCDDGGGGVAMSATGTFVLVCIVVAVVVLFGVVLMGRDGRRR